MSGAFVRELWFLLRRPASWLLALGLAAVTGVALAIGGAVIDRQVAAAARVAVAAEREDAVLRARITDAGGAAYGRFHTVWDAPRPLAFLAIGHRDLTPTLLRVRALALEGQIHEGETVNPELALAGRFDFAFVLLFVAPLVLVALLHDLRAGEREAGRLAALEALPRAGARLWLPRVAVRAGLAALALVLPLTIAGVVRAVPLGDLLIASGITLASVLVWTVVIVAVVWRVRSPAGGAALALGVWIVVALVAPGTARLAIDAAVPVPDLAAIVAANREAVHGAWDLPRQPTLERFYRTHPEWADSPPMERPFHWKWYFAFQQLGDEAVAAEVAAWRAGVARRERLAQAVGWALPPLGLAQELQRRAGTDVDALLAHQEGIRAFHERLRRFYYPYLFRDRPFGAADWDAAPAPEGVSIGGDASIRAPG